MPKNQIQQTIPKGTTKKHMKTKSTIFLIFILPLLLLTSCGRNETWLSCIEKNTKAVKDENSSFYLKIVRRNGEIQADYFDSNNSNKGTARETPIALNFAANIHIYSAAKRKRIIRVIYSINRQNLKFSKTIRYLDSSSSSISSDDVRGIRIQNAGICRKLNTKPQSLI